MSPLANSYLKPSQLNQMEPFYPLRVHVCDHCFLVQLEEFESPVRIFSNYPYFSSYSDSWVRHAKAYTDMASSRLGLGANSQVIEIASNDGYLLQHFVAKGIPVLGIEPALNVADAAQRNGIPTLVKFFGRRTAQKLRRDGIQADLLVANNVLAHVPALNDFVTGLKLLLKPQGTMTLEFHHVMRLMAETQFDTIYHEHFSYLSLMTVDRLFTTHRLLVFDVEELPTHGGSLRIYVRHVNDTGRPRSPQVIDLLAQEEAFGLARLESYLAFGERVKESKRHLLDFLINAKADGKSIVGYGAAAKGTTLLNYCGIGTDFLDYIVDRSPHKQGHFVPGVHIPIHPPDKLRETKPDYVLILPWNLKDEIMETTRWIRDWGGQFVVPVPVKVY